VAVLVDSEGKCQTSKELSMNRIYDRTIRESDGGCFVAKDVTWNPETRSRAASLHSTLLISISTSLHQKFSNFLKAMRLYSLEDSGAVQPALS
jgi:hypothetical protein